MTIALYQTEPIGVDGAFEATGVLYFCSTTCAQSFLTAHPSASLDGPQTDDDALPSTQCEQCGKVVE